ncbi:hypothetical protein GCM10007386_41000 [Pseudoduganella dura]|nr:hypothetical protein GCM10007386_41000 [Pseudoduganella dura]
MMKILRAVALSLAAATVHAAPASVRHPVRNAAPFVTWHMADLQDVTQAWYFTGEALASHARDGAPWAGDRPLLRHADADLASPPPAVPAVPPQVVVPPTIPEPRMASMLLVGLVLILLRVNRKEERFG